MTKHEQMMEEYFGSDKPKVFLKDIASYTKQTKELKDPLRMDDHIPKKYNNHFNFSPHHFDKMSPLEIENFLRDNREKIELKLKQS